MILRRSHIAAARQALGFEMAGEYEGDRAVGESALQMLNETPRNGVMIGFSQRELRGIWHAIQIGADSVLQSSNVRQDEKKAFRNAVERIKRAGFIEG